MEPGCKLLRLLVALVIGPTSLNGGEGLLPGRRVWLEASWGASFDRQLVFFGCQVCFAGLKLRLRSC